MCIGMPGIKFTQLSLICLPRKAYSRIDLELKKANVHANSSTKIINLCKAVIVQHIFLKSTDISLHLPKFKSCFGIYFTLYVKVWYNFT